MALTVHLEKQDETAAECVYRFGSPVETAGRVRLDKESGDIELIDVSGTEDGPSKQFYLAHLVPRLQDYHDRDEYPSRDRWSA